MAPKGSNPPSLLQREIRAPPTVSIQLWLTVGASCCFYLPTGHGGKVAAAGGAGDAGQHAASYRQWDWSIRWGKRELASLCQGFGTGEKAWGSGLDGPVHPGLDCTPETYLSEPLRDLWPVNLRAVSIFLVELAGRSRDGREELPRWWGWDGSRGFAFCHVELMAPFSSPSRWAFTWITCEWHSKPPKALTETSMTQSLRKNSLLWQIFSSQPLARLPLAVSEFCPLFKCVPYFQALPRGKTPSIKQTCAPNTFTQRF